MCTTTTHVSHKPRLHRCLMPDNFTHQGQRAGTHWVNLRLLQYNVYI
jgi:hypothetical protein